jgi:hypothetical protein
LSGPIVKTSCPFSLSNWRTVIEILHHSKTVVSQHAVYWFDSHQTLGHAAFKLRTIQNYY